jgi:voltage-gated potassium channel
MTTPKINYYIIDSPGRVKNLWQNNIILLVALVVLIFIAPLRDHLSTFVGNSALLTVVLSGIYAADYQRRTFRFLLALGFLVLISMTLSVLFPGNLTLDIIPYVLTTFSLIFSTVALVAHVSQAKSVERSTVLCAINSYLLMGLTASILFLMLDLVVPPSFPGIESGAGSLGSYIYFGFVTLSTLGYGDITPGAPFARSLSIFVALAGQLYLVIVMALIIGKFLNSKDQKAI